MGVHRIRSSTFGLLLERQATTAWLAIWVPGAGTAFFGFSGLDLVYPLLVHASELILQPSRCQLDRSTLLEPASSLDLKSVRRVLFVFYDPMLVL
jgi:hypothetical protein